MSSSLWHLICDNCLPRWIERNSMPEDYVPARAAAGTRNKCCFCGEKMFTQPAVVRESPSLTMCGGDHKDAQAS